MQLMRKSVDTLIYSNIFIGICAVALTLTNQLTVGENIHFDNSLGFVFFSTLFTYSYLKFGNLSVIPSTTHRRWAQQHAQLSKNILLISLIGTVFYFSKLSAKAELIVAGLALFTAFYGFVDIPFIPSKMKLRDFGLLKTIFVAVVWSITTVVVPMEGTFVERQMMVFLILRRLLFILALTIPFEIKDMSGDRQDPITTLPIMFGVSNTKLLAQGVLLLLMIILTIQYLFFDISLTNMLAVNLSLLISIFCIQPIKEETNDKWYYVALDGMMILQFVFVYLAVTFLS
jgi:4-hydroxybenzoate polyprenyltransferase